MDHSATRRRQDNELTQTAVALSTEVDPGGLKRVSTLNWVRSLTGIRAVAALLVVCTHAAYGTGKQTHGYVGLLYSRLEIGVPIFFVLSGFLLFSSWVKAAATCGAGCGASCRPTS